MSSITEEKFNKLFKKYTSYIIKKSYKDRLATLKISDEIGADVEFDFKPGKGKVTFSVGFLQLPLERIDGGVLSWTRGYHVEDFDKVIDAAFEYVNKFGPNFDKLEEYENNREHDFREYLISNHIINFNIEEL